MTLSVKSWRKGIEGVTEDLSEALADRLRVAEFKVIPLDEHPNFKGEFH